jgi:hypothetical protein
VIKDTPIIREPFLTVSREPCPTKPFKRFHFQVPLGDHRAEAAVLMRSLRVPGDLEGLKNMNGPGSFHTHRGRHYYINYGELLFFVFRQQTSLVQLLARHAVARPWHCLESLFGHRLPAANTFAVATTVVHAYQRFVDQV